MELPALLVETLNLIIDFADALFIKGIFMGL